MLPVSDGNAIYCTPSAADPTTDLSSNTTQHLIADLESLRAHLGITQWLVVGGSWDRPSGSPMPRHIPTR